LVDFRTGGQGFPLLHGSVVALAFNMETGDAAIRQGIVIFRGLVFGVFATIVVALLCGYVVLRGGLIPANADASPGWLETWAATTSLNATLGREAPKGLNPVAMTDDNLCVHHLEMSLFLPFRNVTVAEFGRRAGAEPVRSAAPDRRPSHRV
jgi:hypothetical protein